MISLTKEKFMSGFAEAVALESDHAGPMAHAARKVARMTPDKLEAMRVAAETMIRYLTQDPEVADAFQRGDVARVLRAVNEMNAGGSWSSAKATASRPVASPSQALISGWAPTRRRGASSECAPVGAV